MPGGPGPSPSTAPEVHGGNTWTAHHSRCQDLATGVLVGAWGSLAWGRAGHGAFGRSYERSWQQRRLAPGGVSWRGAPVPGAGGTPAPGSLRAAGSLCPRALTDSRPTSSASWPSCPCEDPRGRLLHGAQGTGRAHWGFRPPRPALAGDGGTFHPPPLTRGVWPQPGAPPGAEARGQVSGGRGEHSAQSSMGQTLADGQGRGPLSGWEVHAAGWPWETGAVGTAPSRQCRLPAGRRQLRL